MGKQISCGMLALIYILLSTTSCSTRQHQILAGGGPDVSGPVEPLVQDINLRSPPSGFVPAPWRPGDPVRVIPDLSSDPGFSDGMAPPPPDHSGHGPLDGPDDVPPTGPAATITSLVSVEGISSKGDSPPDTVGDAGKNHYIQMVNRVFRIYDKLGSPLTEALSFAVLWVGFDSPCFNRDGYDPIVRYDQLADRWLLSFLSRPGSAIDRYECVAISRTADPVAGGWYLYEFKYVEGDDDTPINADFPKISVWPDAYYMSSQAGFPNGRVDAWAMERSEMLLGNPANLIRFSVPAPFIVVLPGDPDGRTPPEGSPAFFARQIDGERFIGSDRVEIFEFDVDWVDPYSSTFNMVASLNTDPFDSVLCALDSAAICIPQPDTAQKLESLTAWPMWRLQYRNFGEHESMVFNHTVDTNGEDHAGIRWYELKRLTDQPWSIFQQGTYASDEVNRWMGSIAMDLRGNIALGYSVSSTAEYPGLRIGSRVITDAPGSMPQPEFNAVTGNGSQTSLKGRYGNYSSMDVDPEDQCVFWYTSEYYAQTSEVGWKTRIVSFTLPICQ